MMLKAICLKVPIPVHVKSLVNSVWGSNVKDAALMLAVAESLKVASTPGCLSLSAAFCS